MSETISPELEKAFAEQMTLISAEPNPLLALFRFPDDCELSESGIRMLQETWQLLWKGNAPFPLVILPSGCDLTVIRDPRAT